MKEAGLQRGIKVRIAQDLPSASQPDDDTRILQELGVAEVRSLDFKKLVGAGILHTKLMVVDQRHFFVGSANMDWRSLTQVKLTYNMDFFLFKLTSVLALNIRLKNLVPLYLTVPNWLQICIKFLKFIGFLVKRMLSFLPNGPKNMPLHLATNIPWKSILMGIHPRHTLL